jgi:hypothetical protein
MGGDNAMTVAAKMPERACMIPFSGSAILWPSGIVVYPRISRRLQTDKGAGAAFAPGFAPTGRADYAGIKQQQS